MALEIMVSSVTEYVREILQLQHLKIVNSEFVFRGQADCSWPLLPSIGRKTINSERTLLDAEMNLVELARYRIPQVFDRSLTPIDRLALMQHYGIPTRLLDVTNNPLVALFFACRSIEGLKADAEVIVFERNTDNVSTVGLHQDIAETYRVLPRNSSMRLCDFYNQTMAREIDPINNNDVFNDILHAIYIIINYSLCFVRSTEQLARQYAQNGSYILFANKMILENEDYKNARFVSEISEIPKDEKHIIKRIIIPEQAKQSITCDLKKLGVTEDALFPDNYDLICNQIVKNEIDRLSKNYLING